MVWKVGVAQPLRSQTNLGAPNQHLKRLYKMLLFRQFNFFNSREKFPESLMTNSNIKLRVIDNFTSEKIVNTLKDIGIAPHRQMEMVSD